MKRVYAAMALLCVMTLLPRCAGAQGFGGGDGSYATSPGVTPMDFLGQADGCPFMAMALYQQYTQQAQLAGRDFGGDSGIGSTAGRSSSSTRGFASTGIGGKKKKRIRKSVATKKAISTEKARSGSPVHPGEPARSADQPSPSRDHE